MNESAARSKPSKTGAIRTGADYLASIKNDGRHVVFDGDVVRDVTTHPAFGGAARSIARLFDVAADPANAELMTFTSPKTGAPVWRCYHVPKTAADLASRRLMSTRWAEETFGLMGRTPDHVAGFLAGYAAKPSVFAEAGKQFAENVVRYHEHARDNSLYLSYAIVPPQIDRSKPAHKQSDPTLHAGVVKERDDGIVLKGCQQLATGAAFSDAVYISCIHPLTPGDEAYAFAVAVPANAPGLKIYARRPYATTATSAFDYPLSTRFDEIDALLVLDDVFVPWENVFCHRNLQLCRDQWWRTPSHSYGNHQSQARYATKLRFLMGLTKRLCEITGVDAMPPVQIELGGMAAFATIVELDGARAGNGSHDRRRRHGVAVEEGALRGDVAASGDQPAAEQHSARARRRLDHHVAVLDQGFSESRDRGRHRALYRLAGFHLEGARGGLEDGVGFHRHRVRRTPRAIREVLRRRVVPG